MSHRRGKKRGQKHPRYDPEEDEEPEDRKAAGKKPGAEGWRAWARDILVAVIIMAVILGGVYAYTGNWPPLVVVESASMQHGTVSQIGVIDTGDLVFVQQSPGRADVVTYLEGRVNGYQTYGDYGDVIVFRLARQPSATPVIHRAIAYVTKDPAGGYDVSGLANLVPGQDWMGFTSGGQPTSNPYGIDGFWLRHMGYNHDLNITFYIGDDFASFFLTQSSGYITMGDNNAYLSCSVTKDPCQTRPYDHFWFPRQSDIIGHARGEIPWFGLLKLVLSPAPDGCCPSGWGDPRAPSNSWSSLALAIAGLIALPFILEAAAWAWSKYAWPWLGPKLPRRREKRVAGAEEHDDDAGGGSDSEEEPGKG